MDINSDSFSGALLGGKGTPFGLGNTKCHWQQLRSQATHRRLSHLRHPNQSRLAGWKTLANWGYSWGNEIILALEPSRKGKCPDESRFAVRVIFMMQNCEAIRILKVDHSRCLLLLLLFLFFKVGCLRSLRFRFNLWCVRLLHGKCFSKHRRPSDEKILRF